MEPPLPTNTTTSTSTTAAHCHFYVTKRKRYCRVTPIPGELYCGTHRSSSSSSSHESDRVACPLDPRHSVYATKLQRHLKKCPSLLLDQRRRSLPCFSLDLNAGRDELLPEEEEEEKEEEKEKEKEKEKKEKQKEKGSGGGSSHGGQGVSLVKRLEAEVFERIAAKVHSAHASLCASQRKEEREEEEEEREGAEREQGIRFPLPTEQLKHPSVEELLKDEGHCSFKHMTQVSSLCGHLHRNGLLRCCRSLSSCSSVPQQKKEEDEKEQPQKKKRRTEQQEDSAEREGKEEATKEEQLMYVELGAGKGWLSHVIQQCNGVRANILVDRQNSRHKAESWHREELQEGNGGVFERINIDIKDLDLSKVSALQQHVNNNSRAKMVVVGKHLCGGASDLAFRCVANAISSHQHQSETERDNKYIGIAIALCCHHRCDWTSYVNKKFFRQLGFTPFEFKVMAHASRTLCLHLCLHLLHQHQQHHHNEKRGRKKNEKKKKREATSTKGVMRLSREEKEELGRKCKELMDVGRARFLEELGYNVRMVRYVSPSISPENTLLLATIPSSVVDNAMRL
ncbi:tRNA:m(4)X modification enzyme TRM13 [Balamuthia mandrillaris]